ncbi:hypothetical protein PRIPAC_83359 [Pristionchus pacificus]|uniref:Lipoprotein receptor n=1 Tax=Pristionchus pacificus TaxID=54126 RepID=A0A2A6BS26_PRIPA|nr:hypothetical protein PRIPAC_83359 [Pristionchus pacificus]|eukprot:PDM68695.1 lipoprotein receptor [Pristionchus pacificus]
MCYNRNWMCNLKKECANGEDEKNCPESFCFPGFFNCGEDKCIPGDFRCDGQPDCSNGADEIGCEEKVPVNNIEEKKGCASDKFDCGNGKCISEWLVCDGKDDCNDGAEDEMDCRDHPQESCDTLEFQAMIRESANKATDFEIGEVLANVRAVAGTTVIVDVEVGTSE